MEGPRYRLPETTDRGAHASHRREPGQEQEASVRPRPLGGRAEGVARPRRPVPGDRHRDVRPSVRRHDD
jgi:hypothetical protein